ncbi:MULTISPECIES: hypothetical protein [unclassified Sphingomonas]|jgi:hypothetical protein|uniref:hypothetical protein n=1 Tax=unclassified Sphingomonas TaxID=196159 RepID=UPI0012E08831|nr:MULTISPECIES: hypothetical protein [unclassified Sphingomonas]
MIGHATFLATASDIASMVGDARKMITSNDRVAYMETLTRKQRLAMVNQLAQAASSP